MWVAPECRRIGVGRVLIDAIKSWAAVHNLRELRLFVTSMNQGAIDFYIRNGFAMTGRTEPYPNDPMLVEFEMTISIKRN
jgi:ribosomal protein S18 acetylase RimI-like enzyme